MFFIKSIRNEIQKLFFQDCQSGTVSSQKHLDIFWLFEMKCVYQLNLGAKKQHKGVNFEERYISLSE